MENKEKLYKYLWIFMIFISFISVFFKFIFKDFSSIWFIFTFISWIIFLSSSRKIRKWLKSDELSRKIWYTSYACTSQFTLLFSWFFLIANRYFYFVPEIVEIVIASFIVFQLVILSLAYFYFSKNPDKINL